MAEPMRRCSILLALMLAGCNCGQGDPVPFGLDGSAGPEEGDEPERRDDPERPSVDDGRALPDDTRRVNVEGAPIESETALRALWAHDVDDDGDRDAVLVAEGTDSPVRVLFARRDGAEFAAPTELAHAPAAEEGCALSEAALTMAGPWLIAKGVVTCEGGGATTEHFVLSVDGSVRLEERLAILPVDEPGATRLAFGVDDADEDGEDDLTVEVALTLHDVEDRINLHWVSRTSGLTRQADEPAETLNERSRASLRELRGDAAAAAESSRSVLRLHAAVCREPGRARLRVGNAAGLPCGDSEGAGRAITTLVRALAAQGQTLPALDAYAQLEAPGRRINDERRDYARRALAQLPSAGGVTLGEGPEAPTPPPRDFTLSALGFLDEDHVLVRSSPPQRWTIGGGLEPTDPGTSDVRVMDPQKHFAVASLEHRCGAVRLRVVRPSASAGQPPASNPLLWGDDAGCEDSAADGGLGWRLLGWAPQGLVAARGAELRVVPLDVAGQPSGAASTLTGGTPPPAPLPAGASTLDGRFHVELRGPGVLLHEVGGDAPTLLWPEGWAERTGEATHAAVSPSGRRVAVARGGRLFLMERD